MGHAKLFGEESDFYLFDSGAASAVASVLQCTAMLASNEPLPAPLLHEFDLQGFPQRELIFKHSDAFVAKMRAEKAQPQVIR